MGNQASRPHRRGHSPSTGNDGPATPRAHRRPNTVWAQLAEHHPSPAIPPRAQVLTPLIQRAPLDEKATTDAEPVDVWKGTPVGLIVVSKVRGRVGFQTPRGMLMGTVDTDLDSGTYEIRRDPSNEHLFEFITKVKSGVRFTVDLSESEADPWTLSYADPVQLVVQAGMADASPQTPYGDLINIDWLYLMEPEPGMVQPQGPVTGIDDYETITYVGDGKYRIEYRDGTTKTLAYAELTPKMLEQYERIHRRLNEQMFEFEIIAFLAVWPLVEGLALPFNVPGPRPKPSRPLPPMRPPSGKGPASPAGTKPKPGPPHTTTKPPSKGTNKPSPKATAAEGAAAKELQTIRMTREAMTRRNVTADVDCGRCKIEAEKLQGKLQREGVEASIAHVAKPGSGDHSFVRIGGPDGTVIADTSMYQFFHLPKNIKPKPFVGTTSQLRTQVQNLLDNGATFRRTRPDGATLVPSHVRDAESFVNNYYVQ